MDGQEEFRGTTPDHARYACREDAQVTRERGTHEEMLGHSRKERAKSSGVVTRQRHCGGVGVDIFTPGVDGNRSSRLWPVATYRPSNAI